MSKAFTRDDGAGDDEVARPRESLLPPGARNYVTPEGAARLRAEVATLTLRRADVAQRIATDDPAAASQARTALADLDARLHVARAHLDAMEIVDPAAQDRTRVLFGATVTVRDAADREVAYTIVGVDDADPSRRAISWFAPLAKALLGKRVGDVATFRSPRGEEELEVLAIAYDAQTEPG